MSKNALFLSFSCKGRTTVNFTEERYLPHSKLCKQGHMGDTKKVEMIQEALDNDDVVLTQRLT